MVDVIEVSAIVAAAGVLVGVIYYVLDIRHQSKVRQTDLTMRLYTSWVSEEMTRPWLRVWNLEFTDYDDFKKKYGTYLSDNSENVALLSVINSFTIMGLLLQKKLVDLELMSHLPVLMTWNKVKPIIEGIRKETNDTSWYEEFEYLCNEIKKRERHLQQKGVKSG